MPGVVHHGPDPAAIAVCRDVLEESHAACVVLNGSRGWDEQSDLNLIVIHGATADSGRPGGAVARDRERHYRDSLDEQSNLESGVGVVTLGHYNAGRRTLNHPMARGISRLNRSQGEMRIWEEVKQWSTSVSQVQAEELQRVT